MLRGLLQPVHDPEAMQRLSAEDEWNRLDERRFAAHAAPDDELAETVEALEQALPISSGRRTDDDLVGGGRAGIGQIDECHDVTRLAVGGQLRGFRGSIPVCESLDASGHTAARIAATACSVVHSEFAIKRQLIIAA
jgi:hypothetical protein